MNEHAAAGRHFPGFNTRMLIEHVELRLGESGVQALLEGAGESRGVDELLDEAGWSTYDQLRRLLEVATRLLADVGGFHGMAAESQMVRMPDVMAALQAIGSPLAVLEVTNEGDGSCPALEMTFEEVSPTHLRARRSLRWGLEPYPELCAFMDEITQVVPRLLGLSSIQCYTSTCRCKGDEACVSELEWREEADPATQLDFARTQLGIAERRLEFFEQTVADIVTAEDLDAVLGRIVQSAARATRIPAFVMVVDALAGGARYYTEGITEEDARRAIAAGTESFAVDIASTRRHYGRLAAFDQNGGALAYEAAALQSWARLAATALDSAFAIEESRRQARVAGALLTLSTSLAELTTTGDLATRIARAMPDVIDCDSSAVWLVTEGVAHLAAHQGMTPDIVARLESYNYRVDLWHQPAVTVQTRATASPEDAAFMTAAGQEAVAAAPIISDDIVLGFLVAGVYTQEERLLADERLQDAFAGLAGQAAVALRNGRLIDHIRHQSLHDPLTDLPNRALILDRAELMQARARRTHTGAAALFIDLDGFKEINDTLGHGAGDELLQMVAARLITAIRESDTVGRLGGDEFVVLADGASLDAGVEVVAERLLDVLREPFQLAANDRPCTVSASIGIAVGDRASASDLLRDADIALYSAKAAGKNCYRVFAPEMQEEVRVRAALATDLAAAILHEQFFLLYQPIFDLEREVATGVEALLRWQHPEQGVIPPDAFIPLLEESGSIVEVGRWVLHEACRQTAEWHAEGHDVDVSVNASIRQLERLDFVDDVREALELSGLPPAALIIEITETAIMRDAEATIRVLKALKVLGVRIAIDDFGTGYSSLAYLQQFPVDALKIDRSFIDAAANSAAAAELVHTLVRLGKALRLETFAEGIEHRDQLDRLQLEGCDSGQGFMFARPLPAESLGAFFTEHQGPVPSTVS